MSDLSDRERRGDEHRRRRVRRGGGSLRSGLGGRGYHSYSNTYFSSRRDSRETRDTRDQGDSPTPAGRPIILVKPSSERSVSREILGDISDPVDHASSQSDRPITVLRARDDIAATSSPSSFTGPSSPVGDSKSGYQILRSGAQAGVVAGRAEPMPTMKEKVKLIDDLQQWCDMSTEQLLMDQTDFLVVGVLGLHGTGKSSLLSYLTGTSPLDSPRSFIFPPESKENIISGTHATTGIDMCVTPERVIYLDTQPILSTAVLDQMLHSSSKYITDYMSPENGVEIQSLQTAAFLMSVCHVILVVEDWFTDLNLLNFLHTAEMLKPAISTSLNAESSSSSEIVDYCPHIVFIQNKAASDLFTIDTYVAMETTLSRFFKNSNLKHSGSVSLARAECVPGINKVNVPGTTNLFILPPFKRDTNKAESTLMTISDYHGHPSFQYLLTVLRNQLMGVPRLQLTHSSLTEKNWFNYAARMWDQIKKSQIISEYNRFLP